MRQRIEIIFTNQIIKKIENIGIFRRLAGKGDDL